MRRRMCYALGLRLYTACSRRPQRASAALATAERVSNSNNGSFNGSFNGSNHNGGEGNSNASSSSGLQEGAASGTTASRH